MTLQRQWTIPLFFLTLIYFSAIAHADEYVTYLHSDIQGSPIMATDEQGNVVWQEDYEPWGSRQVKDPASATTSRGSEVWYTGKEEEANVGMYYYGARWYSPGIGQFTGIDPAEVEIKSPRTFNRYAYANNNPIKYIDPDGRKVEFAQGSTTKFKSQFKQAIQYLNKAGAAASFAELQKSKDTILIEEPNAGSNDMYYDPNTKTIVWDPLSALKTTNGTIQTPALGLGHEGEHALGDIKGTAASAKNIPGDPYNTAEERRVIQGYETKAANKLKEGTRQDHYGSAFQVKCPTCTK